MKRSFKSRDASYFRVLKSIVVIYCHTTNEVMILNLLTDISYLMKEKSGCSLAECPCPRVSHNPVTVVLAGLWFVLQDPIACFLDCEQFLRFHCLSSLELYSRSVPKSNYQQGSLGAGLESQILRKLKQEVFKFKAYLSYRESSKSPSLGTLAMSHNKKCKMELGVLCHVGHLPSMNDILFTRRGLQDSSTLKQGCHTTLEPVFKTWLFIRNQ